MYTHHKGKFLSNLHIDKIFNKSFFITLVALNIGLVPVAWITQSVVIRNNLFPGGATGIAAAFHYILDTPISLNYVVLNIPIMLLGFWIFNARYIVSSLAGMFFFSFWLFVFKDAPMLSVENTLMSCLLAGVVVGAGTGFYMRFNGSAGGIDIVAAVIKRKYGIPMGTVSNVFNCINVMLALIYFDINVALYSGIFMFITGQVMNIAYTGFSQRKAVLIITSHPDEVSYSITRHLDRGVTFVKGLGSYSKMDTRLIFTIINMVELGRLKELIYVSDPDALICVLDTAEVIGKKFLTWEKQGFTT